jgi:hypothetical protein
MTGLASQPPTENLKFERADWTSFRTVDGLQQKAGVPQSKLRRLVPAASTVSRKTSPGCRARDATDDRSAAQQWLNDPPPWRRLEPRPRNVSMTLEHLVS